MVVKLQMRRGTAVQWTSGNPTLAVGEIGIETDTRLFKIGDGTTTWISSTYVTAGSVIDIAHGGTGATTASGAFNALLAPGTSGYILETRDSGYTPVWIAQSMLPATGTSGQALIVISGVPTWTTAKRSLFLSLAGGWTGTTAPDGGYVTSETTSGKVNFKGTSFASVSSYYHEFAIPMPANYNGGTITAKPYFWTSSAGASGNTVIFGLQGVAFGDGDAMDTNYGSAVESTKTVTSSIANRVTVGAATTAITIAGTPAAGKWTQFRTYRKGAGTFSGNVVLGGWLASYTTNNYSDE